MDEPIGQADEVTSIESRVKEISQAVNCSAERSDEETQGYLKEIAEMKRNLRKEDNKPGPVTPVEFICTADIEAKQIEWLIPGLIPLNMLTILAGRAGEGKTNLALKLAALVSREGSIFNGKPVKFGRTLIWTAEDSAEHILVPRLRSLGADMTQVDIVGERMMLQDGSIGRFDITEDLYSLFNSIGYRNRPNIPGRMYSLFIIDPLVSMVKRDMNQANHVRQALNPLKEMAEELKIAILGITHFSKGGCIGDPQDKIIGSQAFSALSRMTLGLVKDTETGNRRLLILKTNITDDKVGYEFSYEFTEDEEGFSCPKIELLGELQGDARKLMAEIEPEQLPDALNDAMGFLRGILHDGPLTSSQVKAEAIGAGHSYDTIRRAAERLGVEKRKDSGANGKWRWALPADPPA
ncbi:MAG: AAA family ATPase [Oxalobacter sp.]|nr:AAA family ATPase [Oxalobacter sp.]